MTVRVLPLEQLTEPGRPITYGVVKPGPEDPESGVLFIRGGDVAEGRINEDQLRTITPEVSAPYARTVLRGGELVVSLVGNPGQVAVVPSRLAGANLARQVGLVALKPEFHAPYIKYFLMSPAGQAELFQRTQGAVQQVINLAALKKVKIRLPPRPKQERIADTLSAYDDLIDNNRRRIALLEQSARLLYREWFVHLRYPGHEHAKVVDGVPEGWGRSSLGEIATLHYGKALKADQRIPGPFAVYGSSGIVGSHTEALSAGPGIIIGRKGNVGSVYWSSVGFFAIDTVYFIDAETSNLYLYYALQNAQFISTDVAVPGLNRDFAYSRPILVPPEPLVQEFLDLAEPLHQQIDLLNRHSGKLRQARDLLLPRLMRGEIEV